MVGSLNKVTLIGNIGADPEIRKTQDGREIANFNLATSDTWKDKTTGAKKERTEWHRVVVFSEPLVGVIKSYIKKGTKLYIEGSLQTRKWTDNNNQERYTTEVVLQNYSGTIIILDSRQAPGANVDTYANKQERARDIEQHTTELEDLDDAVPF